MMDTQNGATVIKVPSNDPLYLGFLPALDKAMVAAWSEPKVSSPVGGRRGAAVYFYFSLCLRKKIEPGMVR